jgi:cytochrome c oxidase subunit IV
MSAASVQSGGGHAVEHAEVNYIAIFFYLSILTVAELGVYAWIAGIPKVAMLVALAWAKALLVAMYFMHLRFERRTLAVVALTPIVLVTFLCFMLMPDLTARMWASSQHNEQVTAPASEPAAPPPQS